ncbi:hypothetical protein [Clostridium butyricum]|uniref:Uncharacterized protein n=1 Tax=Clostridium butyricum E4 str. BoNT E BL5262 TaxID=632245 RepID=C4IGS9_CLOBU|nr:hypothetical protein [Clostridium butyricum]EDT74824.1 hypothetical protein CBY_2560 [Clostridium butyricum 5521]EEP53345.1 hypothetical protein CLP_2623 [Clostridium butyricum E4 str. BoNT E BL5262]NFL30497.1 hypothetical protein [Clostridium butyricum]NFS19452.1 hypothetical protein [Clostridium butyricum]
MNIELKPVCECGHVFKEIKVAHLVLDGKEGLIAPIPKIIPSYCPGCGKTIGSLSMNCIRQLGVISEDKLKELDLFIFKANGYGALSTDEYYLDTEIKNRLLDVLKEHLNEMKEELKSI